MAALTATRREPVIVRRHSLAVRLTHWVNALCIAFLVMSGLQIFNAHPSLYLGKRGAEPDRPILEISGDEAGGKPAGHLRVGPLEIATTGVLGVSREDGGTSFRAFPSWATFPSYQDLATGRAWHFFFAWLLVLNGSVYLISGLVSGHLRRDLVPDRDQVTPRHLWREIAEHLRLRFSREEMSRRYNALQKMAYLAVVFLLLPVMVATGLTMSPGMDAAFPFLVELFGGRQTARTIHFGTAVLLVTFVAVHLTMVLASGPLNNIRAMVTGWYATSGSGGQR